MISANTLNRVLHYLEVQTDSIHPCNVCTSVRRPTPSGSAELHWEVYGNLLFAGDHEIPLTVEGIDDSFEWRFDGQRGRTLTELGEALQSAWDRCESIMLADA